MAVNPIPSAARAVLGAYIAVHGAQKLFGWFGGHGLETTSKGFERMGLAPARPMAMLAGVSEFGGGLLTAAGVADPLGPITVAGAMAVAAAAHRKSGPLASKGGFELPLTNLAFAGVLATLGSQAPHIAPLSPRLTAVVAVGAIAFAGVALVEVLRHDPSAPTPPPKATAAPL